MRRGTTNNENMDMGETGGSGSSGGTGADGNSKWENYNQGKSSAQPGEGSTPENADSGYDLSTGNTSGSNVGPKD
jgi:hypothetical protein